MAGVNHGVVETRFSAPEQLGAGLVSSHSGAEGFDGLRRDA
jgi:hypothetical protein